MDYADRVTILEGGNVPACDSRERNSCPYVITYKQFVMCGYTSRKYKSSQLLMASSITSPGVRERNSNKVVVGRCIETSHMLCSVQRDGTSRQ